MIRVVEVSAAMVTIKDFMLRWAMEEFLEGALDMWEELAVLILFSGIDMLIVGCASGYALGHFT